MLATDDRQSDKRVLTDEERRREERAQLLREHQSALAFWETVEQYRVKLDSELATMISRAAEIGERVLVEAQGLLLRFVEKLEASRSAAECLCPPECHSLQPGMWRIATGLAG
ncbi:putative retrotransposon hot spot protein 4 (RHS4) [Trypanosoma vivax]|nr:putative retrotransposon hot spot protein 4 (RHS4) [Trypanosoma vivax]